MSHSPTSVIRRAKRFNLVWLAFSVSAIFPILSGCQPSEQEGRARSSEPEKSDRSSGPEKNANSPEPEKNVLSLGPKKGQNSAVGQVLTKVKLQGLTGDTKAVELSDLSGRVTMIHFWGTWCAPCVKEIPHIAEIEKTYRDRDDFLMLAIPCGARQNTKLDVLLSETKAFLKKHKLDLPTYTDVNDQTRAGFHKIAGWRGFPATMVLDAEGKIRGVWLQAGHEVEMKKLVAELLEKR